MTLDYELTHAHRFHLPLSCVLISTSRSKMRETVDVLRGQLRAIDPVFRAGPGELITLLPDTDPKGAAVALERVLAALPRGIPVAAKTVGSEEKPWSTHALLSALREQIP